MLIESTMCLHEHFIPLFFEWWDGIKQVENCYQVDCVQVLLFQDWVCDNYLKHTLMSLCTQHTAAHIVA